MTRLTLSLEKWIWPCSGARGGVAREEFVGIIQATNDGTSVDRAASEQGLIPDHFMVSISRVALNPGWEGWQCLGLTPS